MHKIFQKLTPILDKKMYKMFMVLFLHPFCIKIVFLNKWQNPWKILQIRTYKGIHNFHLKNFKKSSPISKTFKEFLSKGLKVIK
jgi:hypothetical protein